MRVMLEGGRFAAHWRGVTSTELPERHTWGNISLETESHRSFLIQQLYQI